MKLRWQTRMKRFWAQVDVQHYLSCWHWQGKDITKDGYGRFMINNRRIMAHRVAWEFKHGPIPEGIKCLHTCDNPPCCNPDHLFIGTTKDNASDMAKKKRWRNGRTVLTEEKAKWIRERLKCGHTGASLARKFGLDKSTIYAIKRGRIWKDAV